MNMADQISSCILTIFNIHVGDNSSAGSLRDLITPVTLSKFIDCRKLWMSLHLHGRQTDIAAKYSFEYFSEHDEEKFASEGKVQRDDSSPSLNFHTEISKIHR